MFISRVLISYMIIILLQNLVYNYSNKLFLVPNLKILIFARNISQIALHFDKFEEADFKYDNNTLKLQYENTQLRHFWSQIRKTFALRELLLF